MFATARQMETWAHGWEIYDLLGIQRKHTDRIKNIATIGYRTFGWTFQNRQLAVPEIGPYLNLTAPSGALWTFGDNNSPHRVEGSAVEFCQVVTQVRHVDDTQLSVRGENAINWMAIAQCFAGPPETPSRTREPQRLASAIAVLKKHPVIFRDIKNLIIQHSLQSTLCKAKPSLSPTVQ